MDGWITQSYTASANETRDSLWSTLSFGTITERTCVTGRQEWDPRNWDFTSATRPINARERRRRDEAVIANKERGGVKKERWTR